MHRYFECCSLPCLREWLGVAWNVLRYAVCEAILLATITIGSLAMFQLANRICASVLNTSVGNAGEIFGLTFYIGIFTLVFVSRLKSSCALFPKSLQHFQDKLYPTLFGIIRLAFLLIVIPLGLYLQYDTFYYRHFIQAKAENVQRIVIRSSKGKHIIMEQLPDTPELYSNDVLFLVSLIVLVYFSARVVSAYREFHKKKLKWELGHGEAQRVISTYYAVYWFGLTMLELIMAVLLIILLFGIGALLQQVFARERLTFMIMCLAGTTLGQGLAVLEMGYFPLNLFQTVEPFFSLMQWDARRTVLVCFGIPLLSEVYFDDDFHRNFEVNGSLYHFILFAAWVATDLALLVRCQTIFSYGICTQVRVSPSSGSEPSEHNDPQRGHGMIYRRVRGCGCIMKSFLAANFPLNLNNHLRELQQRNICTVVGNDNQTGSISTGTCTSLLNRSNNNNNLNIAPEAVRLPRIDGSLDGLKGSSSVVIVQTLEMETTIQMEELEVRKKLSSGKQKQIEQTDLNANPLIDDVQIETSRDDELDLNLGMMMMSTVSVSRPATTFPDGEIKLKRCPSNLPACQTASDDSSNN